MSIFPHFENLLHSIQIQNLLLNLQHRLNFDWYNDTVTAVPSAMFYCTFMSCFVAETTRNWNAPRSEHFLLSERFSVVVNILVYFGTHLEMNVLVWKHFFFRSKSRKSYHLAWCQKKIGICSSTTRLFVLFWLNFRDPQVLYYNKQTLDTLESSLFTFHRSRTSFLRFSILNYFHK